MKTKKEPTQTMEAFFAHEDVKAAQEVQKRNHYGSKAHREAFNQLKALAEAIGAAEWIGDY
jgi:hypothetical protein